MADVNTKSTAQLRGLRITPRKTRVVADLVRGKRVGEALNILTFVEKRAGQPLAKLLKSAISNAERKGDVNVDKLVVKTITVDKGQTMKRFMPRAQGRATPIHKFSSNIVIELAEAK